MSTLRFTRKQLKEDNIAATQAPPAAAKLDSSLKKNLGFIKKIRTACSSDTINESIINDIRSLSLEKYLSEIIPAFFDRLVSLNKQDDISAAVIIFSCLFQRFQTAFSAPMLALLVNYIFEEDHTARQRSTCVAVVFELNLVAIASRFSDCDPGYLSSQASRVVDKFSDHNVTIVSLRTLMGPSDDASGLSIMADFTKRFKNDLNKPSNSELSNPEDISCEQLSTHIQQLLERYCTKRLEEFERLRRKERKERRRAESTAIKYGKDFDNDLLDSLRDQVSVQQLALEPMCTLLGLNFPVDEPEPAPVQQDVGFVWWDSPVEKAFYEDIPDFTELLADKSVRSKAYGKISESEKVAVFLDFLASVSTEAQVEEATVILHRYVPDNKATRNRLMRYFIESAKTDTIKLLSKFVRINLLYFESILLELIGQIDSGFRSQMHTGKINYRNVIFFSELVKFKLVPSHLIFHKLRNMTVNLFTSNNIEILIIFYEKLGKFLLYEPEYRDQTLKMLELLRQKSRSDNLSHYEKLYLNTLFLNIDSFTGKASSQDHASHKRSDAQEFFHQLYSKVLCTKTYPRIAKSMEQMNFSKSAHAASAFVEVFRTTENLRSDSYSLAAHTMLHLPEHSRFVVVQVVHSLNEQLVRGLDENDYRQSVARTSVVRFLAAMCNAGVLPFQCISDVLFKIMCHGYKNSFPTPDQTLSSDPRGNYFRIQLCCTMLKNLHFERAKAQGLLYSGLKSVQSFLYFLQYYCFCKVSPFPKDIEFSLLDALSKAHDYGLDVEWPEDISAAMKRLQTFMAVQNQVQRDTRENPENGLDAESSVSEEAGDRFPEETETEEENERNDSVLYHSKLSSFYESAESGESENESETESEEFNTSESDESESESDSDTDIRNGSDEAERKQFDRSAHDFARKQFDQSIQHIIKQAAVPKSQTVLKMPDPSAYTQDPAITTGPSFKFLSRSSQAKDLQLPTDSRFVSNLSSKHAQQKLDREKISNIIINMYQ